MSAPAFSMDADGYVRLPLLFLDPETGKPLFAVLRPAELEVVALSETVAQIQVQSMGSAYMKYARGTQILLRGGGNLTVGAPLEDIVRLFGWNLPRVPKEPRPADGRDGLVIAPSPTPNRLLGR